jgi:putative Holliday junction resolvase
MPRGKVLAVDYGTRNVGLADCDELGITVRPLPSLPNRGRKELVRRLRTVIEENRIEELVVGLPWNMNGTSGPAAERVLAFVRGLQEALSLPVRTVDERLSSVEAEEAWRALPARRQRRYRTVDSLAAALILQRFLRGE